MGRNSHLLFFMNFKFRLDILIMKVDAEKRVYPIIHHILIQTKDKRKDVTKNENHALQRIDQRVNGN